MLYILTKLSSPGWEFTTAHKHLVQDQLEAYVCQSCIQSIVGYQTLPIESQLFELLSTSCGAEFFYKEKEQNENNNERTA